MDFNTEQSKKLQFIVGGLLLVLIVCPFKTETVPRWTVQLVDENGTPLNGVTVTEYWRDPRIDYRESRESLVTDLNGRVSFPGRASTAPLIVRLIGPIVAALKVHSDRTTYVGLIPDGPFYGNTNSEFYLPGPKLPEKLRFSRRPLSEENSKRDLGL